MINSCKTCKFCSPYISQLSEMLKEPQTFNASLAKCMAPRNLKSEIDPVSGNNSVVFVGPSFCETQREAGWLWTRMSLIEDGAGRCGKEGRWYEENKPVEAALAYLPDSTPLYTEKK